MGMLRRSCRWLVWGFLLCANLAAAATPARVCPPEPKPFSPEMFEAAASQARDRGLLWRITKGGHSSYLYGTLHVGKELWMAPGPQVRRALQQTGMLALEIDPLDEAVMREMAAEIAVRGQGKLSPALQARVKKHWVSACLPAEAFGQAPAEFQAITLSMLVARNDGLDPSYGSEIMLALFGRMLKRPVVSLESVKLQFSTLFGSDDEELESMIRDGLDDIEAGRALTVMRKLAKVWEVGDLAELNNYEAWCDCVRTEGERKMLKRTLDDRNPGLAQGIDALHARGTNVFAAVGSLHMIGLKGLPAIMAARGYRVERVR